MVSKSLIGILLSATISGAPMPAGSEPTHTPSAAALSQHTIESAANGRIRYILENEDKYALIPLEKFDFNNNTWHSKPYTEAEMLNVHCSNEINLENTSIQYCVENPSSPSTARPTLITKIVSEKSIKPGQKKDVYTKPIMLTLYDFNSDGINEGDIIKTRYRDGIPVNYTMGFRGSVYETWETIQCHEFKVVKSGKGGLFFRAILGWKRGDINKKYEKLLHSDNHTTEAKDFAEKFADITRDKIADYVQNPRKCKQ